MKRGGRGKEARRGEGREGKKKVGVFICDGNYAYIPLAGGLEEVPIRTGNLFQFFAFSQVLLHLSLNAICDFLTSITAGRQILNPTSARPRRAVGDQRHEESELGPRDDDDDDGGRPGEEARVPPRQGLVARRPPPRQGLRPDDVEGREGQEEAIALESARTDKDEATRSGAVIPGAGGEREAGGHVRGGRGARGAGRDGHHRPLRHREPQGHREEPEGGVRQGA